MEMSMAKSQDAVKAYALVRNLQKRFADKLSDLSTKIGEDKAFEEVVWFRDVGLHGGGSRFEARDEMLFNTASVNVSQVHYNEQPNRNLQSATAISTIIHPKNPNVPSIHIHISFTEIKVGQSYWRIMADLNPSINNEEDKVVFEKALQDLAGNTYKEGSQQGDKYFNIPALKRTRGISHFYLENYKTDDKKKDYDFANSFGEGIIDIYVDIITNAFKTRTAISKEAKQQQLEYHTLYLFQVLTLDRGTTSGLMIHNQNDVGIMGSLPTFVNRELLRSWNTKVQTPQDKLVNTLANAIGENGEIDVLTKMKLAQAVREHYDAYSEALSMQASGNTVPSTVNNHKLLKDRVLMVEINDIKKIIQGLNLEDMSVDEIEDDMALFGDDGLRLDLVDAIELTLLLEKEFGVKVTNMAEVETIFASCASLTSYINEQKKS